MHFKYKLLIAFLLVALVPIGIIGEYSILSSTKALTNKALEELENNANLEAEKIENYLNNCKNDIIFLSKSPEILKYAETKHPEDRWNLEFSLLSISLDKGYYQVGYMDDNTIIYVKDRKIPKEEAIERPDIPELEYGQVYVSEIFLKRNKGVFEIPFKPIILFAAPIYMNEERMGYVYIEAYADFFLILKLQTLKYFLRMNLEIIYITLIYLRDGVLSAIPRNAFIKIIIQMLVISYPGNQEHV